MKKHQLLLVYVIIAVITLLPRMHMLDAFTSPDEAQWERNTQRFLEALKEGNFRDLYQQAHPGITTQWLAAASINADTWGEKRGLLAFFLGGAVIYITYLLRRLWGDGPAMIGGLLLALNPLLIGHSRILAMDALLGVFSISAVLHHILWLENKKRSDIVLAGIWTALAILSKMSGVSIIAYAIIATGIAAINKNISWRAVRNGFLAYIVAMGITAIIVFPTLLTDTAYVWKTSITFFAGEHFTQQVHALGPWWYPQAFLIWTTPIQLMGLLGLVSMAWNKNRYRMPTLMILLFCAIFFLGIQYSTKKGDRYMLPIFTTFDIITVASLAAAYTHIHRKHIRIAGMAAAVLAIGWQAYHISQLHPYELAYRNPFFRSVAEHRTMGWGEGLDLAAAYLNKKENPASLLVASYYEGSFAYHFKGKVTSAERLAKEDATLIGADYVVLYRTMEGRAPERWETKVLQEYAGVSPEHTISINGEEYVWIYRVTNN